MPGDHIKGAVILFAFEVLATQFVHNLPRVVFGDRVVRNRGEEVSSVGQTIGSNCTKFWQLKVCTPNFEDVASSRAFDANLESLTSLDDADLSWLDVQFSELGLNVQCALLSHNQKVAIRVDKCFVLHRDIGREDVCCQTLSEGWVARSSDRAEAIHKVMLRLRNIEGQPGKLSWRDMNSRVDWKEVGFSVCVVRQVCLFGPKLGQCSVSPAYKWEGLRMVGFKLRQTYKPLMCDCWPRSV